MRYNIDAHVYAQNTSLQTFQTHCGITEMHTDVFRIPAGRRFRDNADFGGLTLGLRNVCLQVLSQNACLQVFAQNVCRHTFLNPKVKPQSLSASFGPPFQCNEKQAPRCSCLAIFAKVNKPRMRGGPFLKQAKKGTSRCSRLLIFAKLVSSLQRGALFLNNWKKEPRSSEN